MLRILNRPSWSLGAVALVGVAADARAGSVQLEPVGDDGGGLVAARVDLEDRGNDWEISVTNLGLGTTQIERIFFERPVRDERILNRLNTVTLETTDDSVFGFAGDDFGRNETLTDAGAVDWEETGFSLSAAGGGLGPSGVLTIRMRKNGIVQPSEQELTDLVSEVGYRVAIEARSPAGAADVVTLISGGVDDGGEPEPPPTVIPNPAAGAAGLAMLAAAAAGRRRLRRA